MLQSFDPMYQSLDQMFASHASSLASHFQTWKLWDQSVQRSLDPEKYRKLWIPIFHLNLIHQTLL